MIIFGEMVVQDKGTNRTEERGRLSPVTLIQLGATKIVSLALDEKPTSELTVDYVQIFGMKVAWEQVLKDVFTALTARIHAVHREVTILARYGTRLVTNEDSQQTTGFASMTIRVPQENVIPLLRNSRKDGLFFEANTESKPRADADRISGSWSWRRLSDLDASGAHAGAASEC